MEFSPRFISDIISVFNNSDFGNASQLASNLSLENNNVFSRSLVIKVDDDEMEIPVIGREHFERCISNNLDLSTGVKIKNIILSLYDNAPSQEKKTFDSIIRYLFTTVGYDKRLQKIVTSKGDIYYGGKGIIFDKDFTPLLLCTLTARKVTRNNYSIMAYYRPICHINPRVFLESDKLINKGIIKKLIPCYTNNTVSFPRITSFDNNPENRKVKVIVDDFDKFFIKPVKPNTSTCFNDTLNECLIDNMEDIMMLV